MQLELPGRPHLTYCTNIHAGESWREIASALVAHVPAVKRRVSPDGPMGVGLRLSGIASRELEHPARLFELRQFLAQEGLYIFTVNAFPYGPFHGTRVKEAVYEPDWRTEERLDFTNRVADILAELLPDGINGTISTVPGAYRTRVRDAADVEAIADAMLRHAAYLHELAARTGKIVTLALEPEPCCFIETTDDAIAFFKEHLLSADAIARFARLARVDAHKAERALLRHLALCFDVCHAAVGFEDVHHSIARIDSAGIRIGKLQLSSALKLGDAADGAEALLGPFDDGIYLHQTVAACDGELTRFPDLPDAFAALRRGEGGGEWRVHCHVPVFCASYGALQSTQDVLAELLALCRRREVAPHLEVETYTWGVLPEGLRSADLSGDIARELTWVRSQLAA